MGHRRRVERGGQKDIRRCFVEYNCLGYVPASECTAAVKSFGDRAEILCIVTVFKYKRSGDGVFTKRTMRITVSDKNDGQPVAIETTY